MWVNLKVRSCTTKESLALLPQCTCILECCTSIINILLCEVACIYACRECGMKTLYGISQILICRLNGVVNSISKNILQVSFLLIGKISVVNLLVCITKSITKFIACIHSILTISFVSELCAIVWIVIAITRSKT